ncbi:MAG TPA: ribose-5-phosphate isomerase RpiA [Isosphaeraceae bacterium]|jgi:ribose 5-phosphate isomerase A|nr:ribose-5-phosphate isomerase RpiA [Isosphaeraceae bacterium]
MTIAEAALELVEDGTTIGLGTGRAASEFIRALGPRVRQGLHVRGVPTSEATATLAREVGVPLASLADVEELDATFDGADEVAPGLDLIKGLGGALLREKIVAASSRRLVILVGDEKEVDALGAHGTLPIEVVPFGVPLVRRRLARLGLDATLRTRDGAPFATDNANYILDAHVGPIADPRGLEQAIHTIPGVVESGLFLGMAETVLIHDAAGKVRALRRGPS